MTSRQRTIPEAPPRHRNVSPLTYRPKSMPERLISLWPVLVSFMMTTYQMALTMATTARDFASGVIQNPRSLFKSIRELLGKFTRLSKTQITRGMMIVYLFHRFIIAAFLITLHMIYWVFTFSKEFLFWVVECFLWVGDVVLTVGPNAWDFVTVMLIGGFIILLAVQFGCYYYQMLIDYIWPSRDADTRPRVLSPSPPKKTHPVKPPGAEYGAFTENAIECGTSHLEHPSMVRALWEGSTSSSSNFRYMTREEREEQQETNGSTSRGWDENGWGRSETTTQNRKMKLLQDELEAERSQSRQLERDNEELKAHITILQSKLIDEVGKRTQRQPGYQYRNVWAAQKRDEKERIRLERVCINYLTELEKLRTRLSVIDKAHTDEINKMRKRIISTEAKLGEIPRLEEKLEESKQKVEWSEKIRRQAFDKLLAAEEEAKEANRRVALLGKRRDVGMRERA
ncbi:hypothetical protein G7Z17_g6366 [Cylindrodendrum hubeiense]|uniref:Uncharacterized protein n=1 Tax=Cylindrodendrum hubeiense TaxID=595255 RepID=A0A9P5H5I2_9HYPO|nr:hypothetical protein G7Z17_g6366 [Cylindrodendrum hubeiense]